MIKQCQQYSNLSKEKINLISKIKQMENFIWDEMIEDISLGKFVIDFDILLDRFESTKKMYDTHLLIRKAQAKLKE